MFNSTNQNMFNSTKKFNINSLTLSKYQVATCKLFVGNLATYTTGAHLQAIFHSYGHIIECVKVRERYGFVRFATGEQAQHALLACNGIQLNGYPMIVEYAQNEILVSPLSPRTSSSTSSAPFRSHPFHAGRSTRRYQVSQFGYFVLESKNNPILFKTDTKLITPITITTNSCHQTNHPNPDNIPLLSAIPTDRNKYLSSTLNPDASSFTLRPFSLSNHYQQTRVNSTNFDNGNICASSDYYSQSNILSSDSASIQSSDSLSPSIFSAISPSSVLPFDSPNEEQNCNCRTNNTNISEVRPSPNSSLNLFIGDRILGLYGSTTHVDTTNNQPTVMTLNCHGQNCVPLQFDCRDIDPHDPIFIWNFVFYPDISISPFVKRVDIKALFEQQVSLYSR